MPNDLDLNNYIVNWNDAINFELRNQLKLEYFNKLTEHHLAACAPYNKILSRMSNFDVSAKSLAKIPFIPVGLFKHLELVSVQLENVAKTMNSSGTSGQLPSKIYLDKENSINQSKTLARIVTERVKIERAPLLVIDSPEVVKDRNQFSARGAGILGFSMFGRPITFALNQDMSLNMAAIEEFASQSSKIETLAYGFTSIIWEHFILKLLEHNVRLDLNQTTLIHGGGWKKLTEQQVSSGDFNDTVQRVAGVRASVNYYGMVEQTGSIYLECEEGYLHTSAYNEVLVRRGRDFSIADLGESGLIQVLSVLPSSYPGHSIITEDTGRIFGEENCICGRIGKYFKVDGRLKSAEIRGCSDTYSSQFA